MPCSYIYFILLQDWCSGMMEYIKRASLNQFLRVSQWAMQLRACFIFFWLMRGESWLNYKNYIQASMVSFYFQNWSARRIAFLNEISALNLTSFFTILGVRKLQLLTLRSLRMAMREVISCTSRVKWCQLLLYQISLGRWVRRWLISFRRTLLRMKIFLVQSMGWMISSLTSVVYLLRYLLIQKKDSKKYRMMGLLIKFSYVRISKKEVTIDCSLSGFLLFQASFRYSIMNCMILVEGVVVLTSYMSSSWEITIQKNYIFFSTLFYIVFSLSSLPSRAYRINTSKWAVRSLSSSSHLVARCLSTVIFSLLTVFSSLARTNLWQLVTILFSRATSLLWLMGRYQHLFNNLRNYC